MQYIVGAIDFCACEHYAFGKLLILRIIAGIVEIGCRSAVIHRSINNIPSVSYSNRNWQLVCSIGDQDTGSFQINYGFSRGNNFQYYLWKNSKHYSRIKQTCQKPTSDTKCQHWYPYWLFVFAFAHWLLSGYIVMFLVSYLLP